MSPKIRILIFKAIAFVLGRKQSKKLLFLLNSGLLKNNTLLFIHIPKAAGTSISKVIYGKRLGHFSYSEYHSYLAPKRFEKFTAFSVVRNPYARLVSAYEYAKSGGTKDGAIANAAQYQEPVFSSFDSFVKNWLVIQDLKEVELVFRPQVEFLRMSDNESEYFLANLFKLEEVEKLEEFLTYQLGEEVILPHSNRNGAQRNLSTYYTEEIRDIVYELYKEDFVALHYDKHL